MKNKKEPDKLDNYNEIENEDDNGIICKKNTFMNIIHYKKINYNPNFHGVLYDAVERVNKIVFHTYLFIKMYLLFLLENDNKYPEKNPIYPKIDVQFIRNVMNTITYKNEKRGSKGSSNKSVTSIVNFYNTHYRPLLTEEDLVCRDNLKALLNYEEKDIIKNIKTNISTHFTSHLRFFIKIKYGFDKKLEKINGKKITYKEKKLLMEEIYDVMNKIIKDIINISTNEEYLSDKKYHNDITYFKILFIPFKNSYKKDYVPYDVKANPLDYVLQTIQLNKEMEKINDQIKEKNKDRIKPKPLYRLFNALPLRTEIVPKYITLDTVGLIDLFITKDSKKYRDNPTHYCDFIWSTFFRTNTKTFRQKGYNFNFMIKTDGLAVSVLLRKIDGTCKGNETIPYIDHVPISELIDRMNGFVYLDPGKNDLFNAMKETKDGSLKYFKYTQRQRNHYTKRNKYQKIREVLSTKKIINNKTVKDIQSSLQDYNSKTCDLIKFQIYVCKKIEVNRLLFDFYKNTIFRKLNWNNSINTRRNEDLMLNNFNDAMGSPIDTTIILGDWSAQGIKGKESTITKRLRKLFIGRGYKVYLIDEYNTSKLCSCCHKPVEKLKTQNGSIELWKLAKCTSCGAIHNRDHNAPKNMKFKMIEITIKGKNHLNVFKKKN